MHARSTQKFFWLATGGVAASLAYSALAGHVGRAQREIQTGASASAILDTSSRPVPAAASAMLGPRYSISAGFNGVTTGAPTVTNVAVFSTSPNNGVTPYNTGTVTAQITGTNFSTVTCPGGVALDDLDGAGGAVSTQATSCTVHSDTQITATFPAGIRTNGGTGWNVQVTNDAGTNAISAVKLVPRAGLLVSEIYTGSTGATDHEFIELYNPTSTALSVTALGLHFHIRSSTGVDTDKTLTAVTSGNIPAHGFLLLISSQSMAGDLWFSHRDYTYNAALAANGGVYISLSSVSQQEVIDKVGWGAQPANGFEGSALADISSDNSVERQPGGDSGHATDTDNNINDFSMQSTTITPEGSGDPREPPLSFVMISSVTRPTNGQTFITGQTLPNATVTLYAAPDLFSSFSMLDATSANAAGTFAFTDSDATQTRFYRVSSP